MESYTMTDWWIQGATPPWPPRRLPSRHLDMSRTTDMAPLNKGDTRGRRGQELVTQTRRKPQVLSFQYYYVALKKTLYNILVLVPASVWKSGCMDRKKTGDPTEPNWLQPDCRLRLPSLGSGCGCRSMLISEWARPWKTGFFIYLQDKKYAMRY